MQWIVHFVEWTAKRFSLFADRGQEGPYPAIGKLPSLS